jgi:ADP-ribosylglycohydrolase
MKDTWILALYQVINSRRGNYFMMGAIIGDICGSIYEFDNRKTNYPETIELINPECFYTDDTVLTVAVAEAAFGNRDYESAILKWVRAYP